MDKISRGLYLDKLVAFRGKQLIKVITGVRRCGKSTLLDQFGEWLIKNDYAASRQEIIHLNFEDFDNYELRDGRKLHDYVLSKIDAKKMNYVFLDEVQYVESFPDVINSLALRENIDIYVTGSNAYMLSSQIATLISGRYVEIKMLPLSFAEYCSAFNRDADRYELYLNYIADSAFPYTLALDGNRSSIKDYISGIYNTVVLKDVIGNGKVTDTASLERLVKFTFDNIGNPLAVKRIADTLTSSGRKIDVKTVDKYLNALVESFILYKAERYNIKGRELLKSNAKYYVVDVGMRRNLLGASPKDTGHILENVVYLELLRRYDRVFVGAIGEYEIDFVAENGNEREYFQVSLSIENEQTFEREIRPFYKLNDAYPKTVLTLDREDSNYEGIRCKNVLRWLLERTSAMSEPTRSCMPGS